VDLLSKRRKGSNSFGAWQKNGKKNFLFTHKRLGTFLISKLKYKGEIPDEAMMEQMFLVPTGSGEKTKAADYFRNL
jgi:hypothetical protein